MGIKDLPRNLEIDFTLEYPFTGLAKACAHLTPADRLELGVGKHHCYVTRLDRPGGRVIGTWNFKQKVMGGDHIDLWDLIVIIDGTKRYFSLGRPEYSLDIVEWSLEEFLKICNGIELEDFLGQNPETRHLKPLYTHHSVDFHSRALNRGVSIPW